MHLFGTHLRGLATVLDLQHQRQQVIAENIANAETPGYRARDLDFGTALRDAFAEDASPTDREASIDRQATVKIDRNSVDLHTETARLADNSLKLMAVTRFLAGSYAGLKRAISGSQ